ncbi:MAG TPA: hypothetical protein VHY83_03280 [Solirubrobacteraceae bacterium]|jgi:hypothetical protein|nr:hypothetical protein [Solirubrobacteraceae bacterium]
MPDKTLIYVELLDEGVDVWRPVPAIPEGADVYRLPDKKPADETWAFPPGSRVRCEARLIDGGEQLVACTEV